MVRSRRLVSSLVMMVILAACGGTPEAADPDPPPEETPGGETTEEPENGEGGGLESLAAPERTTIRVALLPNLPYINGWYAATELADKYNIDVEYETFQSGTTASEALRAGIMDVAFTGSQGAIGLAAEGLPIRIVAGFSDGGTAVIGRSDLDWSNGVEDLRGRTVTAARGVQELLIKALLDDAGISWFDTPEASGDVEIIYIGGAEKNNAVQRGDVDAMVQTDPHASRAVVDGYGVPIADPFSTSMGRLSRTVVISEEYLERAPEGALAYLAALAEATDILNADPELGLTYATEVMFEGAAVSEEDYELSMDSTGLTIDIDLDALDAVVDYMELFGQLREPVTIEQITDLSFLERIERAR